MHKTTPLALVLPLALGVACQRQADDAERTRDLDPMQAAEQEHRGHRPPGPVVDDEVRQFGETEQEAMRLQLERERRYEALQRRFDSLRYEGELDGAQLQELRDELDVAERHLEAMQRRPASVYTQVRRELDAALDTAERRIERFEALP